ncbi:MAG: DUF4294 domain-containing protein [Bacteroidales bacterium]|nr:DUF4294 domain-containing protein [Bacteroidales bacterium]
MRKTLLLIWFLFPTLFVIAVHSADYVSLSSRNVTVPAYVNAYGDTIPYIALRPYYIYGPLRFRSQKQEKLYWKTVRDVRKCLPLAKLVAATLIETTEYLQTLPDDKAREAHLRQMEKDLVREYEPVLRKMTYSQGKVLLRLIARECDSTPYDILRGYIGTFSANFWQGVARLFTANLKTDYQPEGRDAMIEQVAVLIEQGEL